MNKTVAGIILAVVSVGLIGGIVAMSSHDSNESNTTQQSSQAEDSMNMANDPDMQMSSNSDQSQATASETSTVEIKDFNFMPEKIKVKVGTKVTWTNKDSAKHDIAPDTESPDFVASELLAKGESYSFTFTKAGTYNYHCSPHPYMKASVEVTE